VKTVCANGGNAISGPSVDTTARTIVFSNKAMVGSNGEAGTVNGTVNFVANAATPACAT
jgi:hypothetical protein